MENNSEVVYLYLDDIIPNRFQPREVFDEQALKELAVSIKEHGVIQPIIVRQVDNKYEIIAGERRYKASTMAGLNKIPAIVKNLDDKESSKVALIENVQRRDLSPIEEARTFQKILELEEDMTQEQLAATMGKTQSSVSNKLRLLALPDEIQDALLNDKISERHARCLLTVDDANEQVKLLERIIDEKLTVRELDKIVKEMKEGPSESSSGVEDEGPETAQESNPSIEESSSGFTPPVIKGFPDVEPVEDKEEKEEPVEDEKPEENKEEPAPVEFSADPVETLKEEQAIETEETKEEPQPETTEAQEIPDAFAEEEKEQHSETSTEISEAPAPESTPTEEKEEEPVVEKKEIKAPTFNFDFSKLSNPFLKKTSAPEPLSEPLANDVSTGNTNIPSAVEEPAPVAAPAKDYSSIKTDVDSLITSLKGKGFTCDYKESDDGNKIEYIITIEK